MGRSGKSPPFVQIFHHVIDSAQFAALSGSAVKMLVDMARQFTGKNNGMFSLSNPDFHVRNRWRSNSKRERALRELLEAGFLIRTKLGGRGIGCDRFAITWWPVDEGNHHHVPEKVASRLWMTPSAPPIQVQEAREPAPSPSISRAA